MYQGQTMDFIDDYLDSNIDRSPTEEKEICDLHFEEYEP